MGKIREFGEWTKHFVVHNVLHADDPPHRLAMGVAIGSFVTFLPIMGIQMVAVVVFAWVLRANKIVGTPIVWISNPATFIPIYYSCYRVGLQIMAVEAKSWAWWQGFVKPPDGWWNMVRFYWDRIMEIAGPLWLGCLVVGLVFAIPSYFASFWVIRAYRLKRWGQLVPPSESEATELEGGE